MVRVDFGYHTSPCLGWSSPKLGGVISRLHHRQWEPQLNLSVHPHSPQAPTFSMPFMDFWGMIKSSCFGLGARERRKGGPAFSREISACLFVLPPRLLCWHRDVCVSRPSLPALTSVFVGEISVDTRASWQQDVGQALCFPSLF